MLRVVVLPLAVHMALLAGEGTPAEVASNVGKLLLMAASSTQILIEDSSAATERD